MMKNLENYTISEDVEIRLAMKILNSNQFKILFICKKNTNIVIGSLSDGDIRRHVIGGGSLEEKVKTACRRDFVYLNTFDKIDKILKMFDRKIQAIPVLNEFNELIEIKTKFEFSQNDVPTKIAVRVPVRVSFGGGGSDTSAYISNFNGCTLSTTVSIFTYCHLEKNESFFSVNLHDYKKSLEANSFQELMTKLAEDDDFKLVSATIEVMRPDYPFKLSIHSDFPPQSGLGGSSAICVGILAAFQELNGYRTTPKELAGIAYHAERHVAKIAGGWQDQYAAAYGGINFIEFTRDGDVITPLMLRKEIIAKLESSMLLIKIDGTHNSSDIHKDQQIKTQTKDIQSFIKKNVEICRSIKNAILIGDIHKFGTLLNKSWNLKKNFSEKISNQKVDYIHNFIIQKGAIGGKLIGAGGAGRFLVVIPSEKLSDFKKELSIEGLVYEHVVIEPNGYTILR